ncbi:Ribonuclease MRP protein subunit rmp1 [Wickerhamiella sorbophila]|uniref:Ribonuclease MRP protein subunit rmp1 n=1 Tax=Wickerhamiella sorbophila TaxID=45607 RepID=A0A2T0FH93_9ASCO|nr:Ribonuclease MRP protein subunit rmp1 [Wickerhamiella sorbophila]PRT54373.1 Ribonuclease MRP protein subunit rmp1 [Wickerhamiella sorbophila]
MDRAGLKSEYEILHLIYYKNLRQHRSQRWWKYLRILHRRVRQLAVKFDPTVCSYLVKRLIPQAYRCFHGILAQGAFITLGFALLASLAKIWSILEPLVPKVPMVDVRRKTQLPTLEDIGEVVEDFTPVVAAKKPEPAKPKKKKSKKKRDAIDDIFG